MTRVRIGLAVGALVFVGVLFAYYAVPAILTARHPARSPSRTPHWLVLSGDAQTGTSGFFTISGTGFSVDYTLTVPPGGCHFRLLLVTTQNQQIGPFLAPLHLEAGKQSGTFSWRDIGSGTYLLQEDRTDPTDCRVPWSGRVTSNA